MLLDAAEELVDIQFVFAGSGTAQQANVQDDNVTAAGLDAVKNVAEMVERVVVADRDQNISWARADTFGGELAFEREIELIHFNARGVGVVAATLGDGEHDVKQNREGAAGHSCDGLGEQVHESNQEQSESDQTEANRDLHTRDSEIEGDLEFALAGPGVAKNEHGEAIH